MTEGIGDCEHCLFFSIFSENRDEGECRRYPPVLDPIYVSENLMDDPSTESNCAFVQPVVSVHGGCGEFRPRSKQ